MNTITVNNHFELEFAFRYDANIVAALKETFRFPNYQPQRKVWLLPPTGNNLKALPGFKAEYNFALRGKLGPADEMMYRFKQARIAASMATDAPNLRLRPLGGTLRPFQRAGVVYMVRTRRCLVADEMGLGKTVEALAALTYVPAFPAAIVVPAALRLYWLGQIKHWLPGRRTILLDADTPPRDRAALYIVSYSSLHRHLTRLKAARLRALVCDEAHYLKNRSAKRTQAVQEVARNIPYRFLLTGTPVLNRPQEMISLLFILGTLYPLGGPRAFYDMIRDAGPDRLEHIHTQLRVWGFLRRTREQVLPELPDKEYVRVPVPLEDPAAYMRLEQNFLAWAQKYGQKANPLTRLTQLRKEAVMQKLPAVTTWLRDFLETGEKLVVFAHHRHALEQLGEIFQAPILYGGMRPAQQQDLAQRFQADPGFQLLLASLTVGGTGWTWTAARHAAFIELDWTPGRHDQAEDRLVRIGQRQKVTLWYLLSPDTIDDDIYRLHQRKREVVDALTDGDQNMLDIIASMAQRNA